MDDLQRLASQRVAEAPHEINAAIAACEGNHSWTMMP